MGWTTFGYFDGTLYRDERWRAICLLLRKEGCNANSLSDERKRELLIESIPLSADILKDHIAEFEAEKEDFDEEEFAELLDGYQEDLRELCNREGLSWDSDEGRHIRLQARPTRRRMSTRSVASSTASEKNPEGESQGEKKTKAPAARRQYGATPTNTSWAWRAFAWVFLPEGYPQSVSPDYLENQVWDTLQGFLGYLKGIILGLCYLKGMGVGQSGSSLNGAMFVLLTRDSVGVVSGLVAGLPTFTVPFSDLKRLRFHRITSELIRIAAGFLEVYASVYSREWFLALSCVIVILNTVAGIMATQTRSALVTHFACRGNVADCAAKEGNQDRGVKVFGIPLAVLLLAHLGDDVSAMMASYGILVAAQLAFNILAVRALQLETDRAPPAAPVKKRR